MRIRCVAAVTLAMAALPSAAVAAPVEIDVNEERQTMDGFGFFGAMDVWWGDPSGFISDEWATQVVDDLGISIWRNEYYPLADAQNAQDTQWDEQRPVVEGLAKAAEKSQVPLKYLATVWSPPAELKCAVDGENKALDGQPNPGGTREGGVTCPSRHEDFADWLIEGVQGYADLGIDLYALSIQNEPLFSQPYNSAVYSPEYYAETLANVAPAVREAFPKLKFFGAENMLEMEGGDDRPYFYSTALMNNQAALDELDIWAVHGYSDGVLPTETSRVGALWSTFYDEFAAPTDKPVWMTETSGYGDNWNGGALELAMSMYAALRYGNVSAWVWWQGSDLSGPDEYSLMRGVDELSKRYYVHKHFARFIRPGAKRVAANTDDEELLTLAFRHDTLDNLVVVAINPTDQPKTVELSGEGLPEDFTMHLTTATEDCADQGTMSRDAMQLPPHSLATFVHGTVYEADAPASHDSGEPTAGPGVPDSPDAPAPTSPEMQDESSAEADGGVAEVDESESAPSADEQPLGSGGDAGVNKPLDTSVQAGMSGGCSVGDADAGRNAWLPMLVLLAGLALARRRTQTG